MCCGHPRSCGPPHSTHLSVRALEMCDSTRLWVSRLQPVQWLCSTWSSGVWRHSSWPLSLPSSHGYTTSRATRKRTELSCAEPNEKILCQCFHVAFAHHWLASHARLLLLSLDMFFKARPHVFVVQAFTMFRLFFFRLTLRGGCTILVEFLKCLRGEFLFLFLLSFEMPELRCPAPSILAFTFTTCLLYTSPSPRDRQKSRMPSSA